MRLLKEKNCSNCKYCVPCQAPIIVCQCRRFDKVIKNLRHEGRNCHGFEFMEIRWEVR